MRMRESENENERERVSLGDHWGWPGFQDTLGGGRI